MRLAMPLPLTLRVPMIAAVLMIVMGIVASQLVLSALARSQERHLTELAEIEFSTLSSALGPYVQRDDIWEMFDVLDRATRRDGRFRPFSATLVDARGRVVVSSVPERHPIGGAGIDIITGAIPLGAIRIESGTERISVRSVVSWQGQAVGQLVMDFDVAALLEERSRTWWALLLGNGVAILLLSGAGYAIMRRVLAPIRNLTQEMGQPCDVPQPILADRIPDWDADLVKLYTSYNAMIRAVHDRAEAERRLAERERYVSLGRLAGGLAHEINNPLGGLLNAVDTLRAYPDRPEAVTRAADLLDRGLKHLREVSRSTLDVHRAEPRDVALTRQDFDDLHLLIRPEIDRKAQILDWDIEPDIAGLDRLPAGPVRQIVLNLLLNAADVTERCGEIGLRVGREGHSVMIRIRDSGPGFPDAIKPRLLSDAPLEPGGGLGLRLVRDLVKGLGGAVVIGLSREGRNEVCVQLPANGQDHA